MDELGRRIDAYSDPANLSERAGNHTEHTRLMLDLMALAFWTDTTRISTFMFGNAVSARSFAFLGGGVGSHHETSHHENNAAKLENYQRITQWHIEQYAYLIGKLRSIREGSGTLLDQCMIVLGAGMRDGNAHSPKNLPIILAGRGGGTIATGRHVMRARHAARKPLALDAHAHRRTRRTLRRQHGRAEGDQRSGFRRRLIAADGRRRAVPRKVLSAQFAVLSKNRLLRRVTEH